MSDQAESLRRIVSLSGPLVAARPPARSLVFTSGKGGVGTSNLALNLALALGERGRRVVLLDADLGLANLDLLAGIAPPMDLGDVLAAGLPLSRAIVDGPPGVRLLAGAHGSRATAAALADAPRRIVADLAELESSCDYLLIDAGTGLGPSIAALAEAADEVVLVTTPEPTSMADAHAALRRLAGPGRPKTVRVAVNQARSDLEAAECLARLAASSRQFLGLVVSPLGGVRLDFRVPLAVRAGRPFLSGHPAAPASRDVRRLAASLEAACFPRARPSGFFEALAARWRRGRAVG